MENQSKNITKIVVITVLSILFIALSIWAGASYVYIGTPWWVMVAVLGIVFLFWFAVVRKIWKSDWGSD